MPLDPPILLLNDPTRGVDVETKREIYALLRAFAAEGKAVVLLELRYARTRASLRPRRRVARGPDRRDLLQRRRAQRGSDRRRRHGRDARHGGGMSARIGAASEPRSTGRSSWRRNQRPVRALRRRGRCCWSLYGFLFPGLLTLGGIAKFTQSWFPLALVAMAQAHADADRRHQPGDRRRWSASARWWRRPPWPGRSASLGGIAGVAAVGPRHRRGDRRHRRPAAPAGDRRHARRLLHHRRRRAARPAAAGRRDPGVAVRPAGRQHAGRLRCCSSCIALAWKLYLATPLGLSLYAAGENPVGAFRSGVPVDRGAHRGLCDQRRALHLRRAVRRGPDRLGRSR